MWEANRENLLLFATFSLVLALGTFVLWGPSTRPKRKGTGQIRGLVNLGRTCFLNTLLQALGSCPLVLDWLSKQQLTAKKDSFTTLLWTTLRVLNGYENSEDPFAPTSLIRALFSQGWVISPGEQDAHELLTVMVTALEEEAQKPLKKVCSLLDAIDYNTREVQSLVELPGQRRSIQMRATVSCQEINMHYDTILKASLPFHGLFTSQLQCMTCQHKSALHYATFYSLSLVLPPRAISVNTVAPFYTLQELIGNYVTNRIVNNVSCDGCGLPRTDQVKTLNFGKLPSCLCIHIARTTWEGEPMKRDDYIVFPEILNMDPYTYNSVQQRQFAFENLAKGDELTSNGPITLLSQTEYRNKHLYRLVAVVVHKGNLFCGHFITYRRGVGSGANSWYYTSDTEVRKTNLHEVMESSAYMLFYTRVMISVPLLAV